MYLPTVGYLDYIAKFTDFVVLWQLDAVRPVQPGHLLGILAVVHQLELSQQNDVTSGLPVQG